MTWLLVLAIHAFLLSAGGQTPPTCEDFRKLVRATYDFKPSALPPAQQNAKGAAMDNVWAVARANPKLAPCLQAALEAPDVNPWFGFDGSLLLVELDPSRAAKQIEARNLNTVDLDDVDLRTWLTAVAQRAAEDFDMTAAGANWLGYPDAIYDAPEHSAQVGPAMGALFIYGSMAESQATPALIRILADADHPRRDLAMAILKRQATADAVQGLELQPEAIEARTPPRIAREEFQKAFQAAVKDDWTGLQGLLDRVPDFEKDAVAVLQAEDLPLFRQVRRRFIATAHPQAIEYYETFTRILLTLVSK